VSQPATAHAHAHAHAGDPRTATRRRLALAFALATSYMLAEVAGGLWTGSLALLADAGHMLSDAGALALALFASWVASQPGGPRWTYGRVRAEILAALAQGIALVVVAVLVVREALHRLGESHEVLGPWMLAIATGGLAANLAALAILGSGRHQSLNLRGAWLHVASDALGSLGAMAAGALVWAFGWHWADPAASLAIAALVVWSAWHLIREAVDVLMEAAPRGLDVGAIQGALVDLRDVLGVHDLHVWTVGSGQVALSCHIVVADEGRATPVLSEVYTVLGASFGIDHATVQIESAAFAGETPRSVCAAGACGLESP
jgi:cobalt-zinc-cadmium efflux system protein